MRSFHDDLAASLAHLELPLAHRRHVRTTNLIEHWFEEGRRRTKILPRLWSEHSGIKLIFAVLWRASTRRPRVRITSWERKQLELVRVQLGLTPDPVLGQPTAQERAHEQPVVSRLQMPYYVFE
jgi:transposase-like protein